MTEPNYILLFRPRRFILAAVVTAMVLHRRRTVYGLASKSV